MLLNLELNKKLVFNKLELNSKEDVLDFMSRALHKEGYVKEEYINAIKHREAQYPTGLPSSPPGIAIPHANNELVNKTTLAIATLNQPVLFNNMEDNQEEISIQIVVMMAIAEPHGQIEMLQKIVTVIQNEPLRQELVNATDNDTLLELIKTVLS